MKNRTNLLSKFIFFRSKILIILYISLFYSSVLFPLEKNNSIEKSKPVTKTTVRSSTARQPQQQPLLEAASKPAEPQPQPLLDAASKPAVPQSQSALSNPAALPSLVPKNAVSQPLLSNETIQKSDIDKSSSALRPTVHSLQIENKKTRKEKKSLNTMNKSYFNSTELAFQNSIQLFLMAGVWKESSILLKNDITEIKINTLNTVVRFGLIHTYYNARLFSRYGIIIGQSENNSAVDDFSYFQRSVSLSGAEIGFGVNLIRSAVISFGLSIGGIYRSIKHSLPTEEYRFKTATTVIPNSSLEFNWQFSQHWSWRQSVGTQGRPLDTLWSSGFGRVF